jgi:hypothetical protein
MKDSAVALLLAFMLVAIALALLLPLAVEWLRRWWPW